MSQTQLTKMIDAHPAILRLSPLRKRPLWSFFSATFPTLQPEIDVFLALKHHKNLNIFK